MSDLTSQGYQIIPSVIGLSEIEAMRNAITETIDRVARVLRAPFEMSSPDVELEDRVDAIWRKDRSYAQALFRATLADAHRDERIEAIAAHAVLSAHISESIMPLKRTGQLIRTRASIPVFSERARAGIKTCLIRALPDAALFASRAGFLSWMLTKRPEPLR